MARTAPDWGLLVRPPANLPRSLGYECFEGIIEADRWFGPLFVNLRLIRTHAPIEFDADVPLLQVQPVHRDTYGKALDDFEYVPGLDGMTPADWDDFRKTVVRPKHGPLRHLGEYAVSARKRRKGHKDAGITIDRAASAKFRVDGRPSVQRSVATRRHGDSLA